MGSGFMFSLAFSGTTAAYTVAAVAQVLAASLVEWERLARQVTWVAWAMHSLALALVAFSLGRLPIFSIFETTLFITWLLISSFLLWDLANRTQAAGPFLLPVLLLLFVGTLALPRPGGGALAGWQPVLLIWHVAISTLGYGFFAASFIFGLMYLLQDRQLRRKDFRPLFYRLPPLEALDSWSHRFVYFGWPLLGLGLVVGGFWTRMSQSAGLVFDLKIAWTIACWVVYGIYLGLRRFRGLGGRRAAYWSAAGFVTVVINLVVIGMFVENLKH